MEKQPYISSAEYVYKEAKGKNDGTYMLWNRCYKKKTDELVFKCIIGLICRFRFKCSDLRLEPELIAEATKGRSQESSKRALGERKERALERRVGDRCYGGKV